MGKKEKVEVEEAKKWPKHNMKNWRKTGEAERPHTIFWQAKKRTEERILNKHKQVFSLWSLFVRQNLAPDLKCLGIKISNTFLSLQK